MSIQEIVLKIKGKVGEKGFERLTLGIKVSLLASGLFLGGFSCFLWGKMASQRASVQADPVRVIYPPLVSNTGDSYRPALKKAVAGKGEPSQAAGGNWKFVASKTGKVYYPYGCKSVSRVKPENRVYFESREQAETKGLTLSKSCQ